jgi:hypothetical protein
MPKENWYTGYTDLLPETTIWIPLIPESLRPELPQENHPDPVE